MSVSEVIKFEGLPDNLVWKYPLEEFNATSQLIVDETHEALLVVNGSAADLFPPGRRTLSLPNIPFANALINIPTGGETPFLCKVFFVNKVHQMDLLWGTQGPIALEDPDYQILMHVMLCGSISVSVENTRKFMLKFVGFKDSFDAQSLVQKFRGIISSHVKKSISEIMIKGRLGYFRINADLFEISGVIKECLDSIFEDYGIVIRYFNIESISVPEKDYDKLAQSKERRAGRIIEGFTWQEERQMDIVQDFAGNEGTMGGVGGAVGGFMMGSTMGGSVAEIARNALSQSRIPTTPPPSDLRGVNNPGGGFPASVDVQGVLKSNQLAGGTTQGVEINGSGAPDSSIDSSERSQPSEGKQHEIDGSQPFGIGAMLSGSTPAENNCISCSVTIPENALFCPTCGFRQSKKCSNSECNTSLNNHAKFCHICGSKTE